MRRLLTNLSITMSGGSSQTKARRERRARAAARKASQQKCSNMTPLELVILNMGVSLTLSSQCHLNMLISNWYNDSIIPRASMDSTMTSIAAQVFDHQHEILSSQDPESSILSMVNERFMIDRNCIIFAPTGQMNW